MKKCRIVVYLSVLLMSGTLCLSTITLGQIAPIGGEALIIEPAGMASWQEMLEHESAHPSKLSSPTVIPSMTTESLETSSAPLGAPNLGLNFAGLGDDNTAIPPDTMGAAGPNHLMVMLNTQVRIQNKTGTTQSTVSLATFWTNGTGLSGTPFNPRLIYDSLSSRWMAIVAANVKSATSAIWFAISATNDPTGSWTFYGFDADANDTDWADFPDIGTNSTWIAITTNMLAISNDNFSGAAMWVIDKSTALTGGALTKTFFPTSFDTAGGYNGRNLRPALTFDAAQTTLYIVDGNSTFDFSSGRGRLRLSQITGTAASPSWSVVPGSTVLANSGLFISTQNYNLNQTGANQQLTTLKVETNDSRLLNAVFRNGRLWTTHSGGLPFGVQADRTAVVWYEINPGGMPTPVVQSGVVGGSAANTHYFFPSIAVNANNDVALGFSYTDATQYVEAAFTGRKSTDTAGTMGTVATCKAGEGIYIKDKGTSLIRWGNYSATVVDPTDNLSFWTLQEYAETDVGPNPDDDRWGTWWCNLTLVEFDFGDAPDPSYPTLLSNNGARHTIVSGVFLGLSSSTTSIDPEANGQPTPPGLGDDNDGNDDEDGVTFSSPLIPGQSANIVVAASVAGKLDAWVDFNGNGSWADSGEQIFTNKSLSAGQNFINFAVPSGATENIRTFARFRFSTAGNLSVNGLAANGEVEDYQVAIEEPQTLDFGDAPDGGVAYPSTSTNGAFPTCVTITSSKWSQHGSNQVYFARSGSPQSAWDAETDGNAGLCPNCFPSYDNDECYKDGDAGLLIPEPYTINSSGAVTPCANSTGTALGKVCQAAVWGTNMDIHIVNNMSIEGFINVLIDWNQNGAWGGALQCSQTPNDVREHVVVDFPVPAGYDGPLSGLSGLSSFVIGPNSGYVWARFSISEQRVGSDWDGEGLFSHGETEDYLLKIDPLDRSYLLWTK